MMHLFRKSVLTATLLGASPIPAVASAQSFPNKPIVAAAIQFDVCVRYLKENLWEKFRLMRESIVNTPLQATVRGRSLVSFDILPNDIIELWTKRLVANGLRVVCAMDGLNDLDHRAVRLKSAQSMGVPTEATRLTTSVSKRIGVSHSHRFTGRIGRTGRRARDTPRSQPDAISRSIA